MGCLFSCLRGYKPIPNDDNLNNVKIEFVSKNININEVTNHYPQNEVSNFDSISAINRGAEVDLKLIKKLIYTPKFIWVTVETRKIHMSDFTNKQRIHKEADLDDVTSVTAGPPMKYKKLDKNDNLNGKLCLTINFTQGGGIDLKFLTENERDIWYTELNHILSTFPSKIATN